MKNAPWYPVVFAMLVATIFGAGVSGLALATKERAEAGQREIARARVFAALGVEAPDAAAREALWTERIRQGTVPGQPAPYYRLLDEAGGTAGYALPFRSPGFWGPIYGYLGVDARREKLLGIAFTRQEETPGLGGRIVEDWFTSQFRDKSAAAPEGGGTVLEFVYEKPRGPRQVEAITGATQTSSRLDAFLNSFLAELKDHPAFAPDADGEGGRR